MALTVEDGTGLAGADAYDSIANVETYLTGFGGPTATWTALSTSDKEVNIRKATRWLDAKFGPRWKGRRTNENQALDWPRASAYDEDDYLIDQDEVPTALKQTMAVMADTSASEDLMPNQAAPGDIARERIRADVIEREVEYAGSKSQEKLYLLAERMLAPLLRPRNALVRS